MRALQAASMASLIIFTAFSGCFGLAQEETTPGADDLLIEPEVLSAAEFNWIELTADRAMSVHIPYFVIVSGLVTNSTTIDLAAGDTGSVVMLAPSNLDSAHFLIGDKGQRTWQIRDSNQSWEEWFNSTTFSNSSYPYLAHPVNRSKREGLDAEDGAAHSSGIVDGYTIYEWLWEFSDPNSGFNERWGPFIFSDPVYDRAANFLSTELESFGYEAQIHRYLVSSSPAALNVCGYKIGTIYPDEWLVLGAHLDVAELGSGPGGGTHIGAHDNSAGVAMMLEAARGLAKFDLRRTLVVCFWSNEENGYDGVERWIDEIPSAVTISNYLNIDSAGVNFPGDYTLVIDIIPDTDDQLGEQWQMIRLAEWLGSNNNDIAEVLRNGRQLYHDEGYDAMKDHDHTHPQTISVHESQRGRSDYVRFAERLDVVSMDFGAITGGYDCYHAPCDTVDEMVSWMGTEDGSGQQNLVESFDIIVWWVVNLSFHLDEEPVLNQP